MAGLERHHVGVDLRVEIGLAKEPEERASCLAAAVAEDLADRSDQPFRRRRGRIEMPRAEVPLLERQRPPGLDQPPGRREQLAAASKRADQEAAVHEVEGSRLQLALEQVVRDKLDALDLLLVQEGARGAQQALVDVRAHHLAGRPDPVAEDPKPAECPAAEVDGASAGTVPELPEKLAPAPLPHERLEPQALELRGLAAEQVLLRHRPRSIPLLGVSRT